MEFHRLKPGRRYYLMAVLVLTIGVLFFSFRLHSGLEKLTGTMSRVIVPGSQLLRLDKAGYYTVFYEYRSKIGSRVYETGPGLKGLLCELNMSETEEYISLRKSQEVEEYTVGPLAGISVFEFDIKKPGAYIFTAYYDEGARGSRIVLAIGHEFVDRLSQVTRPGLFVMFFSGVVAFLITLTVFVKRHRAKEQRLRE